MTAMVRECSLALVIFGFVCLPPQLQAGEWATLTLPNKPADIDGFTLDLQLINPEAEGYLPIRAIAKADSGSFPGDRLIELQLVPKEGNFPLPQTSYVIEMLLPSGQSMTEQSFYLPKYFAGQNFDLRVVDISGPLRGYSGAINGSRPPEAAYFLSRADFGVRLAVIIPEPGGTTGDNAYQVPDLRSIDVANSVDTTYLSATEVKRLTGDDAIDYLANTSTSATQILRPSTTHEHWLGYESIDVVLVAYPLLAELKTNRPQQYAALRQWISTGGVLWTYDAPAEQELATLLDVKPSKLAIQPSGLDAIDIALSKYQANKMIQFDSVAVLMRQGTGQLTMSQSQLLSMNSAALLNKLQTNNHPLVANETPQSLKQKLYTQTAEAGLVVAITERDPFPGSDPFWFTVRHLSGPRQLWSYRHGTSLARGTARYWDWLLVNVARPPVYAFLTLLTFFVILVGPVAYQVLRRYRRVHLMFIISPILALLTMTLMFGYGFVADGFGTQLRSRQITWVDGSNERAARYSRSTYFAAFSDGKGLTYSTNQAVYPIVDDVEAFEEAERNVMRVDRSVRVNQEQQMFRGEVLPARRQKQFIAFEPIEKFSVPKVSIDNGNAKLVNNTELTLNEFIYRAGSNEYYQLIGRVAPQAEIALQPLAANDIGRELRNIYFRDELAPPPGFSSNQRGTATVNRMLSFTSALQVNYSWAGPNDTQGIFEGTLRTMMIDTGNLPAGWFIARAEPTADASAAPDAEFVDSVHYVMGNLQ